jgi:hypothetical protein
MPLKPANSIPKHELPPAGKSTGITNPSPKKQLIENKPIEVPPKPVTTYTAPSPIKAQPPPLPKINLPQPPKTPAQLTSAQQSVPVTSKFVNSNA